MFTFDTDFVISTNCSVNTRAEPSAQISSVCLPEKEDVLNDRNKVRKSNLNGLEPSFELISTNCYLYPSGGMVVERDRQNDLVYLKERFYSCAINLRNLICPSRQNHQLLLFVFYPISKWKRFNFFYTDVWLISEFLKRSSIYTEYRIKPI